MKTDKEFQNKMGDISKKMEEKIGKPDPTLFGKFAEDKNDKN